MSWASGSVPSLVSTVMPEAARRSLVAAYGIVRLGQVGGPGARLAEGADPVGQSQQPAHMVVQHGRRYGSPALTASTSA